MPKIPDSEAYALIRKYGISPVRYRLVKTRSEAESAARALGYPVFMKVDSPEIMHKATAGCVQFAKADAGAAFESIMAKARKLTKKINGVIMQEHMTGLEIIIGAKRDQQFGPVLMFGTGGPLAEPLKDIVFRLVPLSRKDASEMIRSTKIGAVFKQKGIQPRKVENLLLKVSKLMEKNSHIAELDLNPVFLPAVMAADVRILTG